MTRGKGSHLYNSLTEAAEQRQVCEVTLPSDARLIAAAPELYEALDCFLAMFLGASETETAEQYNTRAEAAIQRAEAALAKVRGES